MKRSTAVLIVVLAILAIGGIAFGAVELIRVSDPTGETSELTQAASQESDPDAEVIGTWVATFSEQRKSSYNYKPVELASKLYFRFEKGGLIRNRLVSYYDGALLNDSGWFLGNATWSYEDKRLTFSSGKTFVVDNDTFNDIYNGKIIVYHKTEEVTADE